MKRIYIEFTGYAGSGKTEFIRLLNKKIEKEYPNLNIVLVDEVFKSYKLNIKNESKIKTIYRMLYFAKKFIKILKFRPVFYKGIMDFIKNSIAIWYYRPFIINSIISSDKGIFIAENGFFQGLLGSAVRTKNFKAGMMYDQEIISPDLLVVLKCKKNVIEKRLKQRGTYEKESKSIDYINNIIIDFESITNKKDSSTKILTIYNDDSDARSRGIYDILNFIEIKINKKIG